MWFNRASRERGAAAVEMAIVLPLLVLVLGGIIDFGRYFFSQVVLTNAAREGARMIALDYTNAEADARVNAAIGGALGSMDLDPPSYTRCPNPGEAGTAVLTVTSGPASTQFHWLMLDMIAIPPPNLTATGSMRCQG